MRCSSSGVGARMWAHELVDAECGELLEAGADRGLVADDGRVGRVGPALPIEHGAVRRLHAVDGERLLCRGPRLTAADGDAHREGGEHLRPGPAGRQASSRIGSTWSASVRGPVIQVMVPAGRRAVTRSICGPRAAR